MSGAKLSEKWIIEFKAVFHFLCHTLYSLLTQKMKNSGFCATNNEKFFPGKARGIINLITLC
jgi:hypothetical protein